MVDIKSVSAKLNIGKFEDDTRFEIETSCPRCKHSDVFREPIKSLRAMVTAKPDLHSEYEFSDEKGLELYAITVFHVCSVCKYGFMVQIGLHRDGGVMVTKPHEALTPDNFETEAK